MGPAPSGGGGGGAGGGGSGENPSGRGGWGGDNAAAGGDRQAAEDAASSDLDSGDSGPRRSSAGNQPSADYTSQIQALGQSEAQSAPSEADKEALAAKAAPPPSTDTPQDDWEARATAAGVDLDDIDQVIAWRQGRFQPPAQKASGSTDPEAVHHDAFGDYTTDQLHEQTARDMQILQHGEPVNPEYTAFYDQPWWTRIGDDPPPKYTGPHDNPYDGLQRPPDPGPTGGDNGFWDTYFGSSPNSPNVSFFSAVPDMTSAYWRMFTQQDVYEDKNTNPRWKEWHDLPWYQRYFTEPPPQRLDVSGGGSRG
jgi:hypothetical protein